MKKSGIIILVAVIAVLAGALVWYLMSGGYSSSSSSSNSNNSSSSSSSAVSTNSVTIANFSFSPSTIKVKVGDKVTWTNNDSTTHHIVSDSGPDSFSSNDLSKGSKFDFTFTKAGTYTYHCSIHHSMTGSIVVE